MLSEAPHGRRTVRILTATAACGLVIAISTAQPAVAETIKLLTSWGANDKPSYANVLLFKKNVEDISGGNIKIEVSGPEVVPPFQQLQPVVAGVFDVLYTHGAYHGDGVGRGHRLWLHRRQRAGHQDDRPDLDAHGDRLQFRRGADVSTDGRLRHHLRHGRRRQRC